MAGAVKCYYCSDFFEKDKEDWIEVPNHKKRYAHKECYEKAMIEEESKPKLIEYINNLFGYDELPQMVERQIIDYIDNKKYTYAGILNALKYHYEIKHGDIEKAFGRIGIVSFVYEDSERYWKMLKEAQEKNRKIIAANDVIVPVVEVKIKPPKRESMKQKKTDFSFLNEGGDEN